MKGVVDSALNISAGHPTMQGDAAMLFSVLMF